VEWLLEFGKWTTSEWGPGALTLGVLAMLGKGFSWLITLLLEQSKSTITELRADRDFWRDRALACEERHQRSAP